MESISFKYRQKAKLARIVFLIGVVFLVAKPFWGFLFNQSNISATSILVKAFTQRKQEYIEKGNFDINAIQKKLADPILVKFLPFAFFLTSLFPLIFGAGVFIKRFIQRVRSPLTHAEGAWLLNSQLII